MTSLIIALIIIVLIVILFDAGIVSVKTTTDSIEVKATETNVIGYRYSSKK